MGAKAKQASDAVDKEAAELARVNHELKLDMLQAGLDVAGIFDPTPVSDLSSGAISLARGDLIGAGLSLLSIIPYAGDALAKPLKGTRLLKKINSLKKSVEAAISATRAAEAARFALKRAETAILRAKRAAAKAKEIAAAKLCPTCKPPGGNRFGTTSPKEGSGGSWRGGERGNSPWHPDPTTPEGKKILDITGNKPIEFKDGYPDFSPYAKHRVEIDMKGTKADHTAADREMRKLDPKWEKPEGWTWHHNEDGVTMELVPTALNGKVPHTGGDSLTRDLLDDPGY